MVIEQAIKVMKKRTTLDYSQFDLVITKKEGPDGKRPRERQHTSRVKQADDSLWKVIRMGRVPACLSACPQTLFKKILENDGNKVHWLQRDHRDGHPNYLVFTFFPRLTEEDSRFGTTMLYSHNEYKNRN